MLTHDVDKIGERRSHIWRVRNRFSTGDLVHGLIDTRHLYRNIEDIMALEDSYGLRSTFFFLVDAYSLDDIADTISRLVEEGWEVGLHLYYDDYLQRTHDPDYLQTKKRKLEGYSKAVIQGIRSHYLVHFKEQTFKMEKKAGFKYESTMQAGKDETSTPYCPIEGLYELPITVMDSDLWGLWRLTEREGWKYIIEKLDASARNPQSIFVMNAHPEAFHMKGGRLYRDFVRTIVERSCQVTLCKDYVKKLAGEESR